MIKLCECKQVHLHDEWTEWSSICAQCQEEIVNG